MTAVESLESHKQPFHPSHRPCKSRQTSGICTFPPPDDESSLVYRLNAKPNPETINPWVGQNKMPNWTNFSCQRHYDLLVASKLKSDLQAITWQSVFVPPCRNHFHPDIESR